MATINLGSIKFNWQGAYAGGTAYAVDDVVSYNGSSYICILASTGNLPTNATYFEQMSSAGTNGTDLTTTLTTQGDLVYRDGSGLQRLGAGTAGQVLQTGGAGANPSWGTVGGGKVLQVISVVNTTTSSTTSTSFVSVSTPISVSITPSSASSKILVMASVNVRANTQDYYIGTTLFRDATNLFTHTLGTANHSRVQTGGNHFSAQPLMFLDSPSTTSATTYEVKYRSENSSYTVDLNSNNTASVITAMEIGA